MRKKIALMFVLFKALLNPSWAAFSQSEWLAKIEQYMNASKTWEASFEQLNPNGSLYEGTFFLERPGKMRLIYTYPKTQTLIADGTWLIIHDQSNDELTTLSLKDSPAEFFLRDSIQFSQGVTITDFSDQDERIKITLTRTDEPEAGSLTLTFTQNPVRLIQWLTIDANQLKTVVNLKNIRMGGKIDSKLFIFNHPELLLQ
jgi:outer membrane lipoprotein-sorting protein